MSEVNVRDLQCENCRKFSHCNNNELVCISKFQQVKVENYELKNRVKHLENKIEAQKYTIKEYNSCIQKINSAVINFINSH